MKISKKARLVLEGLVTHWEDLQRLIFECRFSRTSSMAGTNATISNLGECASNLKACLKEMEIIE